MAAVSNQTINQFVRSIAILPIASNSTGLPESGVRKALAHIPIAAGSTMAPDALVIAIERADKAIQSTYEGLGRSVCVEHETSALGRRFVDFRTHPPLAYIGHHLLSVL